MHAPVRVLAAAIGIALLATLPTTSVPAASARTTSTLPRSEQHAGAPRLHDPHPCDDAAAFTCSALRVPLDHTRHTGRLDLAVATSRATDGARGTLLVLTGGPGQPGVPYISTLAERLGPVLEDYRLVMIDQRGTGANALACPKLQDQLGSSDLFVPTDGAVRQCARIVGGQRRFYSSEDTVADLDMLRRALGVRSWTVDGVSYGTYVAERYAIAHPHRVRRLVLDSVVPHRGVGAFETVPMRATARVLRDVCAARSCPADPARDLATAVRRRDDDSDILNALTIWEFVSADYEQIPETLHAAATGDMGPLDDLIGTVRQIVQAPADELSQGLHASTLCADGRWPWGSSAAPRRHRRRDLARAAAHLSRRQVWPFEVDSAAGNGILQTCLRWPPTRAAHGARRRRLPDVPVLLLGGERDLSTPIEWLRAEARSAPDARVVIVPDATHSVQNRASDPAGREAVYDFLG